MNVKDLKRKGDASTGCPNSKTLKLSDPEKSCDRTSQLNDNSNDNQISRQSEKLAISTSPVKLEPLDDSYPQSEDSDSELYPNIKISSSYNDLIRPDDEEDDEYNEQEISSSFIKRFSENEKWDSNRVDNEVTDKPKSSIKKVEPLDSNDCDVKKYDFDSFFDTDDYLYRFL